ncbi:MAG: SOS response-associated peptidase [Bacillaceae bacterium]|nr:SOS response-associated peptidase [Bacillaceae bacterium]
MCGRFTLVTEPKNIIDRFEIQNELPLDFGPRYNIAPSQPILAVIHDGQGNRGGFLRWGLIPSWAKDPAIGHKMINARGETVHEKPSFKRLIHRRRCLIPADSFYEWKKEGDRKQPLRIRLKNGEPFAMAGLWDRWTSPEGEEIHSCTIITTRANSFMNPIHDRMPVILTPESEKIWLDRSIEDPDLLRELLVPYDENRMEAYPVTTRVNSPRHDVPECIEPLVQDEQS